MNRVSESFIFPPCTLSAYDPSEQKRLLNEFSETVAFWYVRNGRSFPWRETDDPYRILLSELMLQQTQTQRVEPKYAEFISLWPDLQSIGAASLTDILLRWKGLGYNRRAKALKDIAVKSAEWGYTLPCDYEALLTFPMIGPATASAILAFSYNVRSVYLETNIRRVILHYFFSQEESVPDREVRRVLELLADLQSDYRSWYYALMDIGVVLRNLGVNPNRRSRHYAKQSPFENSFRQVRSTLLDIITTTGRVSLESLDRTLSFDRERIEAALESLEKDDLVVREGESGSEFFKVKEE